MTGSPVGFNERVYEVVCRVPAGRVATYGDIASVLGNPRLARQVGWALAKLTAERARHVPWQRIINAQGRISSRGEILRAEEQLQRLVAEGVPFDASGRCDLAVYRCSPVELAPEGVLE